MTTTMMFYVVGDPGDYTHDVYTVKVHGQVVGTVAHVEPAGWAFTSVDGPEGWGFTKLDAVLDVLDGLAA